MANVGSSSRPSRSVEVRELCPSCGERSATLVLLTSMMRYYVCDACGHRWQHALDEIDENVKR